MKILKLLFFLIIWYFPNLLGVNVHIIPIFYDKQAQKTYGLFVHKMEEPAEDWSSIKIISRMTAGYSDIQNRLHEILGNLYDQFQFDYQFHIEFALRDQQAYFIPAKKFISATALNALPKKEIDGFIWLDLDELARQDKDSPKTFMFGGKQYFINKEDSGFSYHFVLKWKYDEFAKSELQKYIDFMKTQPAQKVTSQGAGGIPQDVQPEPYQPQIPSQREVLYPKDVRPEDKFYYDAVSNAPSKLLQNIKIAKERGTLNNFIGGAYGVRQTALTKSLIDHGNPIIIKILLENGANSNLADAAGNSPIYWAIFRNRPKETIALLLQHGANPNVKIETQDASGQVSRKPLIDIVQDENVKKLLEYYINNPVKPSIVPTAPIANDVIRTLQQLIFSLRQLQQKINELPQSQKEPEALGKVVGGETPYQILGISPQATPQEIKKAYFKAAQKWHPDKWAKASPAEQEQAGIMFDKIKNAYEELTNPQKISSSVKKGEYTSQAEELVEKTLASQEEALGIRIVVLNKYTTPILGDLNLGIQGSLSEFKKAAKKNDQSAMNRTFKVIQEQLTSVNDFMRQVNDYIVKQYPASKTLRSDVFADAFKEFIAVLVKNGLRKKFINKNKAAAMKLAGLFKNFFENNSFFDTDFMQRRYTNKIMKTLNA